MAYEKIAKRVYDDLLMIVSSYNRRGFMFPRRKSKKRSDKPDIEVKAGRYVNLKFWADSGFDRNRTQLEQTIDFLPEINKWRETATKGVMGTKWEKVKKGLGNGVSNTPTGTHFMLVVRRRGCSEAEFDAAFAAFSQKVRVFVLG